jgi:uncharacterized protein (PEP-CTERM system associated)
MCVTGLAIRWRLLLALCAGLAAHTGQAAGWKLTPEISLEESLTDNVRLANVAGDRQTDLISILTPGLTIEHQGRRLDLQMKYQLQGIFYTRNASENRALSLVDAKGTGELLDKHLFVDVGATSSEQNIGNVGAITLDNFSLGDARARVDTYRISPYWRQAIANLLEAELRYERNSVRSSAVLDRDFDSDNDILSLVLASGPEFSRVLWEGRFTDQNINNPSAQSTRFRNAGATLQYRITEKFALKAVGGYDDNEYASNNADTDGYHWRLGGVYRPSRRTSLEAAAGERYFGRDILIELSHRHRKFQWNLGYNRQPETPRSFLLEQPVFLTMDAFGNPLPGPVAGQQDMLNVNLPGQSAAVFILSRLEGALRYSFRKNSLDVSIYRDTRESEITGLSDKSSSANLAWTHSLNSLTDARLSLLVSENETASRNQEFLVIEYGITRSITKDLQAGLTCRYVAVDSNFPGESYQQGSITASIRKQF